MLIALVKTETTIRTILSAMHLPTGPQKIAATNPSPQEESPERDGEVGEADLAGGKAGYPPFGLENRGQDSG